MNQFTVTAPAPGFSGESVGVVFKDGVGHVNDSSKEGRAAIEYFRRRGYTLTPEGTDEAEQQGPQQGTTPPADQFDPSERSAEQVLAYLESLVNDDTHDTAEFDRVIAAERDGKNRKTILTYGEHQQEARQ